MRSPIGARVPKLAVPCSSIGRVRLTVLSCAAVLLLGGVVRLDAQAYRVKDINPGSGDGVDIWREEAIDDEIVVIDDTLYFAANDGVHGEELWRTDGTEAGTVLVKDINPGSSSSLPRDLTRVGNILFFRADDSVHGSELWKSDGTAAGTVLVKDINPGPERSSPYSHPSDYWHSTSMGNLLFFIAYGSSQPTTLWKSDGTAEGTVLLKENLGGLIQLDGRYLRPFAGAVYFSADTDPADGGGGLWRSDGTDTGTVLVKPFGGSPPFYLTAFRNMLYFGADENFSGGAAELWRSNGTTAGTALFRDLNGPPYGSLSDGGSAPFQVLSGKLFLGSLGPMQGAWVTDGTEEGTRYLHSLRTSLTKFVGPAGLTFFAADDYVHGTELWRTDGTPQGTVLVKDIKPGGSEGMWGLSTRTITCVNGAAYFLANDKPSTNDWELWRSDGTAAGTAVFQDIYPGLEGSYAVPIARAGNLLYLNATDASTGRELWALNVGNDPVLFSFAAASGTANEATGTHTIAVTVTTPCGTPTTAPVSVSYATINGTAIEGEDYTAATGTLTFLAGSPSGTTLTISVTILNDPLDENDETLLIQLSAPAGGSLGTPTTHALTIADDDPPLSFFSLRPCRMIDTRNPDGPLGGPALVAGTDRVFTLIGTCDVPAMAKAVAVNMAVTGSTASGHLRIYPTGTPLPLVSALNYSAGQTRGNNAIVTLDDTGRVTVWCAQLSGTTHFILDVTGYFH